MIGAEEKLYSFKKLPNNRALGRINDKIVSINGGGDWSTMHNSIRSTQINSTVRKRKVQRKMLKDSLLLISL